ncbi:MAG: NADPH-dependent FMN reductase [Thermoanaerobaculia bacterium]
MQTARPSPVRVLVFSGSSRKESLNARLASVAEAIVRGQKAEVVRATMADFDCPSYDGDVESIEGIPAGARRFRERLLDCDAFLVASPEYNGSLPGVLKNAIDWASRFRPQPFNGKQGFLMSASPSMAGGNRGLWALRVPLEHLGARIYPDMFSLAQAHNGFKDDAFLANEKLHERLVSIISCFLNLVEAAKHYPQLKKDWIEFLGEHPDAATDRVESATT